MYFADETAVVFVRNSLEINSASAVTHSTIPKRHSATSLKKTS